MSDRDWYEDATIYSLDIKTFNDSDGDGWGTSVARSSGSTTSTTSASTPDPPCSTPARSGTTGTTWPTTAASTSGSAPSTTSASSRTEPTSAGSACSPISCSTTRRTNTSGSNGRARTPNRSTTTTTCGRATSTDAHNRQNIFPEYEDGVWSYDETADKHYFHQFYGHQPDLNVANPAVREELYDVLRFWLDQGADGFRIDAAHPMLLPKGHNASTLHDTDLDEPIDLFKRMREVVEAEQSDAVLLAEADDEPENLDYYFGDGEAFHLQFNFVMNAHLTYGVGVTDTWPLDRAEEILPDVSGVGGWVNFLRNHDEWNLLKLPRSRSITPASTSATTPATRGSSSAATGSGSQTCTPGTTIGSRWLTACCSPCPDRSPSSPATRSGWAPTSPPRARGRPHPDAVGRLGERRLLDGQPGRLLQPRYRRGRIRLRANKCRRTARRPRLAALEGPGPLGGPR